MTAAAYMEVRYELERIATTTVEEDELDKALKDEKVAAAYAQLQQAVKTFRQAVDALPQSAVGLTTYANSLTLTPGTISVEVSEKGSAVWVHAITKENADGFADDEMNRKVAWMDGVQGPGG